MKASTLQEVRKEYQRIEEEHKTLLSYKKELIELSEDEKVKRFLELSDLVDRDYTGPSKETMIMSAYQGVPEAFGEQNTDSNFIMVYMGSYINNVEDQKDYMTYERDPDTNYKSYMDLETTEWYNIDKDECLEFEKEHLTLYLPITDYTAEEYSKKYFELQKWFKVQLIHRSQSDVIEELIEKYERKYKDIYPSFHKIDTIASFTSLLGNPINLPIEEYVKKHPKDGFIENYCLSNEELMRVRLYRRQNKVD